MNTQRKSLEIRTGSARILDRARGVIRTEAAALTALIERLDDQFVGAVDLLASCPGHAVVTGIGKAGLIGQKVSASLSSLGTPSYFLHPAEALHGDLGRIRGGDVLLAFSYSGETEEILRLLAHLRRGGTPVIGVTAHAKSRLALAATVRLCLGDLREAGHLAVAPSTSTTAMLALGDALALVTAEIRGLSRQDFARRHPGGSLGWELARVDDVMRPLAACRVASQVETTRAVLSRAGGARRRSGAILLTDEAGILSGIFTDSDLARLFELRRDDALDQCIERVMTRNPVRIRSGSPFLTALDILRSKKISELPVVDPHGRPVGCVDITDVVTLLPASGSDDPADATAVSSRDATAPRQDTIPFPRKSPPDQPPP